jgi:hypothetical protein
VKVDQQESRMTSQRERELMVFISNRESVCGECGENRGTRAWVTVAGEKGALYLTCADLDHLVFLPSGDAALTRRARKHATLSAVVLKWSRARKQYERQGLLVEEEGLRRHTHENRGILIIERVNVRKRNLRSGAWLPVFTELTDAIGLTTSAG